MPTTRALTTSDHTMVALSPQQWRFVRCADDHLVRLPAGLDDHDMTRYDLIDLQARELLFCYDPNGDVVAVVDRRTGLQAARVVGTRLHHREVFALDGLRVNLTSTGRSLARRIGVAQAALEAVGRGGINNGPGVQRLVRATGLDNLAWVESLGLLEASDGYGPFPIGEIHPRSIPIEMTLRPTRVGRMYLKEA